MAHKIVDIAPFMCAIRNELLINGDNPTLEDILERLRRLPDYKHVAHWQWNNRGYWECSACKNASDMLKGEAKNINPYLFVGTKFCNYCGSEMRKEQS